MVKYTAQQVIDRAILLADLQNSSFITWGESFWLLNQSYREIYNDMIAIGDTTYLKELELLVNNTASVFNLPTDFYQLAALYDKYGNDIPLRPIDAAPSDPGYEIVNNTLRVFNSKNAVIMKYYPIPDTITNKEKAIPINNTTVQNWNTGWGDYVALNSTIYNVKTGVSISAPANVERLGNGEFIDNTGIIYSIVGGSQIHAVGNATLTESGIFVQGSYSGNYNVSNDDLTAQFYFINSNLYYNGTVILSNYSARQMQYIYWNGKHAVVTTDRIIYEDGTWETTDSQRVLCLLKTDTTTGYGYVVRRGSQMYIEGWTPNTQIDYPNNILFDITAYKLAIHYRMKQNADYSALAKTLSDLLSSYHTSISQDASNYPIIKNTRNPYFRLRVL